MQNLVIREDANNKISVSNLSRHRPNSVEEVMQLILEGNKNRTCSPTEAMLHLVDLMPFYKLMSYKRSNW